MWMGHRVLRVGTRVLSNEEPVAVTRVPVLGYCHIRYRVTAMVVWAITMQGTMGDEWTTDRDGTVLLRGIGHDPGMRRV